MPTPSPDFPSVSGNETINSLYMTYIFAQQVIQTLWLNEQDEELKSFYANLMAYLTIIKDNLSVIGNTNSSNVDLNLITLLLAPLKLIFPASWFRLAIGDRVRKLGLLRASIRRTRTAVARLTDDTSLDLSKIYELRDELIEICEETLQISQMDDLSGWPSEDLAPQISIGEPLYTIANAAQSIFKAMAACTDCPCKGAHDFGARLYLGTYRKPRACSDVDDEEIIDFDMFLSTQQDWQEVRIHASRNKVVQVVTMVEHADNSQPKRKRKEVRIQKIKRLCETIAQIKSLEAYRLELKVLRNQLFKLQSERSDSAIDTSLDAISLDSFLRHRNGFFTERTKRILVVILASTVFHLHNTPWLPSIWCSSDILFFRTSSSAIPLKPFIITNLSKLKPENTESNPDIDDTDSDDLDPDDFLDHQCPAVITLAIVLLEVYFGNPFDLLAQRFNVHLATNVEALPSIRYLDADLVFQACKKEIPQNSQFYLAVESCLDPKIWQYEEGNSLDELSLRTTIYRQIVLPLETELSQAFSSIPIEDLDKYVQEVNFGSWGEPIHGYNIQTNASASDLNSQASAASGRSQPWPGLKLQHSHLEEKFGNQKGSTDSDHHEPKTARLGPSRHSSGLNYTLSDPLTLLDSKVFPHSAYTVGILCALPLELRAVRALFDTKHTSPIHMEGDSNNYAHGMMGYHMIVAACLPSGEYGTNAAADSASNMRRTYSNIKFCLLVGIGGGAPCQENDIRLGDVVVSLPKLNFSGVIQYDRGKEFEGSTFELTGYLQPPPRYLTSTISSLLSNPDFSNHALQPYLGDIARRIPDSPTSQYGHPGQENDRLFDAVCSTCLTNGHCPNVESHLRRRPRRPTDLPEVHYGLIASGNRVLKDATARDRWAQKYGILCFEMEAAGVMNTFPCLVIRGICDYADAYKNKRWQNYAAATAAAYAKLLLRNTPPSSLDVGPGEIGDEDTSSDFSYQDGPRPKRRKV